jgi:hypothetical protein
MRDEYRAMVEGRLAVKPKNSKKILFQCHFVYHESHMKRSENGPEASA